MGVAINPSSCNEAASTILIIVNGVKDIVLLPYIDLIVETSRLRMSWIVEYANIDLCIYRVDIKNGPLKSSHFQNSSILFARFLVCSTSDQVTADAFGNHLG
jgi:hypothetical protein